MPPWKTLCCEIVLVNAGGAGERDGGQKLLESLILLALYDLLAAFGFSRAQVVLQAAVHRIVERELERHIADRMRGNTPEVRVNGRAGILRAG